MKNIFILFLLMISINAFSEDLDPVDSRLIEEVGIPVFKDGDFVYGNKDIGFRFAASVPSQEVQKWYREKLPEWSLFDKYGSWILHDGDPGMNMGEVMSRNQVSIKRNEKLPEWHTLDKAMTTEIVIMVVK